ncbi:ABC transporter G family member 19 [Hordeum vulgare]|nr:ABC transporter G family member 19 [Hordeum vulgare]
MQRLPFVLRSLSCSPGKGLEFKNLSYTIIKKQKKDGVNIKKEVTMSYIKQISSYVMQDDHLFPMLTMPETLTFAAEVKLRPSLSRAEKLKRVWELIEQLGLQIAEVWFKSADMSQIRQLDFMYLS